MTCVPEQLGLRLSDVLVAVLLIGLVLVIGDSDRKAVEKSKVVDSNRPNTPPVFTRFPSTVRFYIPVSNSQNIPSLSLSCMVNSQGPG